MVLLVTIGWVVGPVLVLYLAGRAFTDCTRIAMGFWIVPGLRIGFCLQACRSTRRTQRGCGVGMMGFILGLFDGSLL